ncbi:hypothetical protein [Mesorhizobium sp. Root695]|nr:hypothetical protein [Mesorhizobium sp. Root695]
MYATSVLHETLLKTVREVTEKESEFIRWFGGGSAQRLAPAD